MSEYKYSEEMQLKVIIDEKALHEIKAIASQLFHRYPIFNRDLLLLEALQSYMLKRKIDPGFEVNNDSSRKR